MTSEQHLRLMSFERAAKILANLLQYDQCNFSDALDLIASLQRLDKPDVKIAAETLALLLRASPTVNLGVLANRVSEKVRHMYR